jgi:hypothetical protein
MMMIQQTEYAKYSSPDMSYEKLIQIRKLYFLTERLISYEFQCFKIQWLSYVPFSATFPTQWFSLQKVLVFSCILRTKRDISLKSIKYLIFVMQLQHVFCEDACEKVNE